MVEAGKLTTVISNVALVIATFILAGTVSQDILIQAIVGVVGLIIAYLDVKYPRAMDTFKKVLDGIEEEENKEGE